MTTANTPTRNDPVSLVLVLIMFNLVFCFVVLHPRRGHAGRRGGLVSSVTGNSRILAGNNLINHMAGMTRGNCVTVTLGSAARMIVGHSFMTTILPGNAVGTLWLGFFPGKVTILGHCPL